ncbi:SDR family oxidoreductase [Actinocorallia longicatena]|uniref:Glucose 1-dehydrogenase n=1 Tax=Actinocorallia longicatena TaxID=111803 RepID=A0ABP6QGC5_9ACTN
MRLQNKVAIVTGAGSGIGRAAALRLAKEGASVVVADLHPRNTADLIVKDGGAAVATVTDVSDEDAVRAMVATALERFGRLDVLHNNAAALGRETYGRDLDLENLDLEVWDRTLSVSLRGAMLGCKHAAPHLGEGASIINTTSVSALLGDTDHFAYGSAKGALITFTKYVATLYGERGIRCNAIAPGLVLTDVAVRVMTPERLAEKAAERVLPWAARPEDVADLVAFLASDESRCITGQTIVIDSGTTAHRPEHALRRHRA